MTEGAIKCGEDVDIEIRLSHFCTSFFLGSVLSKNMQYHHSLGRTGLTQGFWQEYGILAQFSRAQLMVKGL